MRKLTKNANSQIRNTIESYCSCTCMCEACSCPVILWYGDTNNVSQQNNFPTADGK